MNLKKEIVKIEKYNQKGEGIGFLNNKPIYVFGSIVNEEIQIEIIKEEKKYCVGKILKIINPSLQRREKTISNQEKIGGYELIHMKTKEQINFKKNKVKEAFFQIAKEEIKINDFYFPKQKFYYRNKVTLHDGFFYEKWTNTKIEIEDYKLSSFKPKTKKKGEIIIRNINGLVEGRKGDQIFNYDTMFDYQFRINIGSFYQINKEVATIAYEDIKNYVIKNGITFDLYSGIATIAIIVSHLSKKVIAVENNKYSYQDAKWNIKKNNIKNINYYNKDVYRFLKTVDYKINTLIVDPSRPGLNKKIIEFIKNILLPQRIIYLSCNPATQARDYNLLKNKYTISFFKIYDMFPQTYHCESLMILDLKN